MERTLQLRTEVDGKPVSAKITYTVIRPPPADPHKCYHCDSRKAVVLKYTIIACQRAGGDTLNRRQTAQVTGDFYVVMLASRETCDDERCKKLLQKDQWRQLLRCARRAARTAERS